ncbi:hypothetical protein L873DRAFT_1813197 [Choiromyces venosus 120613-1]|uniref:Uncharacterized protein n=1 Tax=Choiromyces venosus 120613-1 TaxID=1336337 RepID=A0A3N4JE46_9PEZI|nr:hypothetical protein L873DRAFT_1813197 [Choiromyces venosus 120613-1]
MKGSGETKKQWIKAMASSIPFRSDSQVGYKLDNLKKSYHQAVSLASQSGWGLGEEYLTNMDVASLQEKLERKCPFFSHLDTIWGNRPNIRPPSHFSSGSTSEETVKAASNLIHALEAAQDTTGQERIELNNHDINNTNSEIQDHSTWSPSSSNLSSNDR